MAGPWVAAGPGAPFLCILHVIIICAHREKGGNIGKQSNELLHEMLMYVCVHTSPFYTPCAASGGEPGLGSRPNRYRARGLSGLRGRGRHQPGGRELGQGIMRARCAGRSYLQVRTVIQ